MPTKLLATFLNAVILTNVRKDRRFAVPRARNALTCPVVTIASAFLDSNLNFVRLTIICISTRFQSIAYELSNRSGLGVIMKCSQTGCGYMSTVSRKALMMRLSRVVLTNSHLKSYFIFPACNTASVLNAITAEGSSELDDFRAKDYATTGEL